MVYAGDPRISKIQMKEEVRGESKMWRGQENKGNEELK